MKTKTEVKEKSEAMILILKFIKAIFISLIVTFASIIIFAFVIKWANLPDSVIAPVNLFIKGFSVFLGAMSLTKKGTRGLVKGFVFAVIYTILSFIVFSCLAGTLSLSIGLLTDLAFNIIVGVITGVIFTNKKV